MRTNFRNKIFLLLPLLLLLPTGCKAKKTLPFYQLENGGSTVLTVEDVRYIEDTHVVCTTNLPGCWEFTGKTGDVIGVCGGRSPERGGYDVCESAGDEERRFLYVLPNRFVFGPYITYILFREDTALEAPSAETVSHIVVTTDNTLSVQHGEEELTDTDLIAALLDFYLNDAGDHVPYTAADENVVGFTLTFHHQDYPFLTCMIRGDINRKTGAVCLTCQDQKRRRFPSDFPYICLRTTRYSSPD